MKMEFGGDERYGDIPRATGRARTAARGRADARSSVRGTDGNMVAILWIGVESVVTMAS